MSFILDALKRSENERQRTVGPSLADAPMRRIRPERPWWAVVVAALLVVNLGVLIVVLTRNPATAKQGDNQPAKQNEAAAAMNPSPQFAPAAAPPAQAPPVQQAAQPAMEPAEPILPSPAAVRPRTNPAVRSLAEEAGASGAGDAIDPRMSAAMAAAAAVPEGPPAVRPIQPPAVTPLPPSATFKSVAAPGSAKAGNDEVLPSATDLAAGGTSIPDLKLDIHVFSANPAERFVFVNMRKYLEGQTLQEGPTVEKITTDGVILNQRGLRYTLPRQ